jgi:hypothetical protein
MTVDRYIDHPVTTSSFTNGDFTFSFSYYFFLHRAAPAQWDSGHPAKTHWRRYGWTPDRASRVWERNPAYQTHHAEFGNVPIGKMPRPPAVVRN